MHQSGPPRGHASSLPRDAVSSDPSHFLGILPSRRMTLLVQGPAKTNISSYFVAYSSLASPENTTAFQDPERITDRSNTNPAVSDASLHTLHWNLGAHELAMLAALPALWVEVEGGFLDENQMPILRG